MSEFTTAPCGSWRSPITAELIARGAVPLTQVEIDGDDVYWLEGRRLEGGRYVLVKGRADGTRAEVTPEGFNVRTRVHEYGGGSYLVHSGTVYFSNFADQRLYRQDPGDEPRAITPHPDLPAGARYADGRVTPNGNLIICVRELHAEGREAVNEIVALPVDGSQAPLVMVSGNDFYASPRISPDGGKLAWLAWDHPRMPWDGTELWIGDLSEEGTVSGVQRVAGGPAESIFQPAWDPAGTLHFVSDRTGWWNLYRLRDGAAEALAPMEAEFGMPQWVFGNSTYAFPGDGSIACIYTKDGMDNLGIVRPGNSRVESLDVPRSSYQFLRSDGRNRLVFIAASPTEASAVTEVNIETGAIEVLRRSVGFDLEPRYISTPRQIDYPTDGGQMAHAIFYPPANRDYVTPSGERPPLLVLSHGGPTARTPMALDLDLQFWTSRGFAVVEVNYGGSTGYGRAYRERLKGQWGIVDVVDCINAARYLVERGEVDGRRLAIRGGSAGGYTTLCALTFHDVFAAGASYYGVADLEALELDTHKFESRYSNSLVGPYPEMKELYRARSPIHFADRISCPVILFQGLEDRVVPPSQSETMMQALRQKGLPVAYITFEGEQHGFRRAENIQRALEAELYFYSRVLGFPLTDPVEPVPIENL